MEILLYGYIGNYSAETFIQKMEEAKNEDITLRINSGGGDVFAGYGMISKFAEHPNVKKIKVDGQAASMAAQFLCYAKDVEALDVSEFLIHRAAYPTWYESQETFKGSQEFNSLVEMNKNLRKALENKIDVEKFEKITGKTLDEIYSMDSRIDVILNAQQAKKIGLINKVNELTLEMANEINSHIKMVAQSDNSLKEITLNQTKTNKINMTTEKLKSEHPEVYASVFSAGVKAEKDRVGAFMAFSDIDIEAVKKGISGEESPNQTFIAEMTVKGIKNGIVAKAEEEAVTTITTESVKTAETEKAAKLADFEKSLDQLKK